MWSLDKSSTVPYYQQICEQIITSIQTGELNPGDTLPPERQLASLYEVNRSTIVRALEELVSLGWITRRQGSGTRVAEGRWGSRQLSMQHWRQLLSTSSLKEDPYLASLKQHQGQTEALDLYTGDLPASLIPDFKFPSITWERVLQEERKLSLTGYSPLKEWLLTHLERQLVCSLESQDLLVTSGSTQGISLLMQVLLEAGDTIATEDPSFLFALPLFSSLGIHLVGIKQDNEGILPRELESAIQQKRIKLLYLNPTHQNPTGHTMSLQRRKQIIAICEKHQLPIIEDDVFGELAFDRLLPSLKSLAPEQVIYVGSLSKLLGPSIKIGWLLAPKNLITTLAHAKKSMDIETDLFPQWLATEALTSPDYPLQQTKLINELKKRNEQFLQAISALKADWSFQPITGGLYYWLTWKHQPLTRKDWQLFLDENLLIAPSFLFSSDTMSVRINYTRLTTIDLEQFKQTMSHVTNKLRKAEINERNN